MRQTPLVIAHGGGRCYGPPNSLEAIEKSLKLNVDMVEIDVHLSKDRIPVVFHDHDLREFSDVEEKFRRRKSFFISDFKLQELKLLNVGKWFVEELEKPMGERVDFLQTFTEKEQKKYINSRDLEHYKTGVKIPTLEEVLRKVKQYKSLINIEIKQLPRNYPNITKKVIAITQELNMVSQVIISCFDHEELATVKNIHPGVATAVLVREKLHHPHVYCQYLEAEAYNISCLDVLDSIGIHSEYYQKHKKIPKHSYINELHEQHISLNVWTVNDVAHMKALVDAKVDGIISDYPHRLQKILAKRVISVENIMKYNKWVSLDGKTDEGEFNLQIRTPIVEPYQGKKYQYHFNVMWIYADEGSGELPTPKDKKNILKFEKDICQRFEKDALAALMAIMVFDGGYQWVFYTYNFEESLERLKDYLEYPIEITVERDPSWSYLHNEILPVMNWKEHQIQWQREFAQAGK